MFNSIAVDLQPLVLCCLYTTMVWQRKKDFGEIEKIEKYRMFTVELCIILFFVCVCVCMCVCGCVCVCLYVSVDYICILLHVVIYVIVCM